MITPARLVVIRRAGAFAGLIAPRADRLRLDRLLVLAVVCQESAGDPCAARVERGFWRRYGAGVAANVKASVSTVDDRWVLYPDFMAASYGLMQVLYAVALEVGMDLPYPTSLCDPALGIEAGCRVLRRCFDQALITRDALLRYNGGARAAYASEVLAWRADAEASDLVRFP